MKRTIPLLFVLTAGLAVAACGETKTLDTTQVEKDIQQMASEGGVETSVECPSEVKDIEKGTTYDCTITYAGNQNNRQTVQMRVGDNDESEFANEQGARDEGTIRQIVAQADQDPAVVCEHVSEEILEQLGGDDCPANAEEQSDGEPTVIKSVRVEGDTATMATDESTTTFERDEEGGWVATAIA